MSGRKQLDASTVQSGTGPTDAVGCGIAAAAQITAKLTTGWLASAAAPVRMSNGRAVRSLNAFTATPTNGMPSHTTYIPMRTVLAAITVATARVASGAQASGVRRPRHSSSAALAITTHGKAISAAPSAP